MSVIRFSGSWPAIQTIGYRLLMLNTSAQVHYMRYPQEASLFVDEEDFLDSSSYLLRLLERSGHACALDLPVKRIGGAFAPQSSKPFTFHEIDTVVRGGKELPLRPYAGTVRPNWLPREGEETPHTYTILDTLEADFARLFGDHARSTVQLAHTNATTLCMSNRIRDCLSKAGVVFYDPLPKRYKKNIYGNHHDKQQS